MKKRSTVAGSSMLAISRALAPIIVAGTGLAIASPAQAQSTCSPLLGATILCPGNPVLPGPNPVPPVVPVLNIPDVVGPVTVTLGDGFQSLDTVNIGTLGANSDVTLESLGTAVINTVNQPGLVVNSGGAINGRVTTITTSGDGATGALLHAVDDVIFTLDDTISTVGDNAPALDVLGRGVTVNAGTLTTAGNNSDAARLVSLNGPTSLTANLIQTNGNLSRGAVLSGLGTINLSGGAIRTNGTDAAAFDISNDAAACVILGNGGCDKTVTLDEVTTNGFGSVGGLVTGAGRTNINIGALRTGGDEAAGLNISTDPAACIVLGAGACGTAFTIQNLTTEGARSPGAIVRAGGPIAANVDVLRTGGDQAAGLDLASDPDVCAVLGAGQCGTSFNVGQLTTGGAGATGVLVRGAGPITGHVGVLQTAGNGSNGIDLATDPVVCLLVGGGGCDVGLTGDAVSTKGGGAAAVLINAVGNVTANLGALSTTGNGSNGLSIVENPTACLVLGPGHCGVNATVGSVNTGGNDAPGVGVTGGSDPITVTVGTVNTGGANSPGVGVTGTGPITVNAGTVNTVGPNSPGIDVAGGGGPIGVTFTNVTTKGNDSPGVDITGNGPIQVHGGTVTTGGDRSDGISIAGGAGPVLVDVGAINTGGANSNGVDVTTASGNQTIVAGPITVTGPGSNGIVATSPGCSAIDITARGPISSAQGTGILASSACSVRVTTLAGAPVTGRVAAINVTSGTGSTITIGDAVSSTAGPAVNVDGAATVVMITPTGSLTGYVDLTDNADTLTNNGTFTATGNSAFGAGADTLNNNGVFAVRPATANGTIALTGLETFNNSGLIDLRNGATGTTLTMPGTFNGTGGSTVGMDIAVTTAGATADRLTIGGAATGRTAITLAQLQSTPNVLVNDLVLVDAGAGSSATAFSLDTSGFGRGLVGYRLAFDAAANDYALYGTPNAQAYELAGIAGGARQIFYRTNDAASAHMQSLRDAGAGAAGDTPRRSSALWMQAFGSADHSRYRPTVTAFGQSQTIGLDNTQDFFGGQIGYDVGGVSGGRGAVFGITGGYSSSSLGYRANADRIDYDAINGGVYANLNAGPFFLNGLARYEHYYITVVTPSLGIRQKLDGDSYGGMAQVGLRLGSDRFFIEPAASIEYVRTNIDTLNVAPASLDFDSVDGLRGKAGARLGTAWTSGTTRTTLYVSGQAVHEFEGRDSTRFASGGQFVNLGDQRLGTYGRGTIGFNVASSDRVSGFIEAYGDYSREYRGGGGRAGLSVRF